MKRKKWLLFIAAVTLSFPACKKNAADVIELEASKTVLSIGEPVKVQINHPYANAVSKWSVQPSVGSTIDNVYTTGSNSMKFTEAGTYRINAELRTVQDDCHPSAGWDTCFSKGRLSANLSTTITVK